MQVSDGGDHTDNVEFADMMGQNSDFFHESMDRLPSNNLFHKFQSMVGVLSVAVGALDMRGRKGQVDSDIVEQQVIR